MKNFCFICFLLAIFLCSIFLIRPITNGQITFKNLFKEDIQKINRLELITYLLNNISDKELYDRFFKDYDSVVISCHPLDIPKEMIKKYDEIIILIISSEKVFGKMRTSHPCYLHSKKNVTTREFYQLISVFYKTPSLRKKYQGKKEISYVNAMYFLNKLKEKKLQENFSNKKTP